MSFKHSFKILMAKFSLVWSLLLYFTIAGLVVASIGVSVLIPFFENFSKLGLGEDFKKIFDVMLGNVQNAEEGLITVSEAFMAFYNKLINEFFTIPQVTLSLNLFLLGVIGILARLLFGMSELGILKVLEGHMSSNAQFSYSGAFVSMLGKSFRYQIIKMPLTLAMDLIIIGVAALVTRLYVFVPIRLFLPFLITMTIIFLVSIRQVILSAWGPAIAVDDKKIRDGFNTNFKLVFRRKTFWRKFSVFITVNIIALAVNFFVTIFTVGVGALITIPWTILWYNTINMTLYYIDTGRRYYTDSDTIITTPVNII